MISKVIMAGRSAISAESLYLLKDEKQASIIAFNGVRPDFLSEDFKYYADLQPGRNKNLMLHSILSFHPDDKNITEGLCKNIAQEYLDKLGFGNSAFCVIAHQNRNHYHLHILACTVDLNGNNVDLSYVGLRGKKIAMSLTEKYGLIVANKKNFSKTNFQAFRKDDKEKYKLFTIINSALKYSKSYKEFEKNLINKGIEIKYKYKSNSSEIQGISFKSGDFCFKGSEIDRNFSYSKLNSHFENSISKIVPLSSEPEPTKTNTAGIFSGIFLGLQPTYHVPTSSPFKNPNDDEEEELRKKRKKKRSRSL